MGKSNKFSLATKSHSSTRVNPYDKITLNALNVTCPDKEVVLPRLKGKGAQIVFIELYSLFIFILALGAQYLNLYRSTWWLSKNRNNNTLISYHHLINSDVPEFSLIFIGQSSLISILRALMNKASLPTIFKTFAQHQPQSQKANTTSSSTQPPTQLNSTTTTSNNNTSNNNNNSSSSLLLTHPHPPQLSNNNLSESQQQHGKQQSTSHQGHQTSKPTAPASSTATQTSTKTTTVVTTTASLICNYFLLKCAYRIWTNFGLTGLSAVSYPIIKFDDDKICHNCSNQPDEIRDEVDRLRTIFNERLKFVLYKSMCLAYYSSFLPMLFAQSFLYYDHTWTAQHVALTWLSSLIMLISSSYTPHFYDVLHRSAYHFGKWHKLETRNTLVPCINWSENVIYPQGVVVKHYGGYFRSESAANCAQPGVASHLCYYIVFSDPKIGFTAALVLLGLLLSAQMYLLLVATEWYKLIAMTCMMSINVYSIFRLVKSLVVITNIYKRRNQP